MSLLKILIVLFPSWVVSKTCIVSNEFADGNEYSDIQLQAALDECSTGGRVYFPPGVYLLSPFNLTSNIELNLDAEANLLATGDQTRWPVVPPLPSYPGGDRQGPFIGGNNVVNISITGLGTIDGQGSNWWNVEGLPYGRPRLIEPMFCQNFTMRDVTVKDPPFWAIHPYACDQLLFENIIYSAPVTSPNTDGIDPDSCSNVVIRNLTAFCGDDVISIKSGKDEYGRDFSMPSKNILIEGGNVGPSSGIDIGSEMSGDVYNVVVRDVSFTGSAFGVRIKSGRGRGGYVRNVTFENLRFHDVLVGLAITMHYTSESPNPPFDDSTPHIQDITYRNITGTTGNAGAFFCLLESACRDMYFENVNITSLIGGFECVKMEFETNVDSIVSPEMCGTPSKVDQ